MFNMSAGSGAGRGTGTGNGSTAATGQYTLLAQSPILCETD